VLNLLARLNRDENCTVVLVLHDINQAARYSHHVIAMRNGAIVARGEPADVVTEETIAEVFGVSCVVIPDPVSGTPLCVPKTELPEADSITS
jgi:ABC-type cobalamin/Fe3+-siderophores transport system ATPase subunit